jgi:hypothetical protein
LIFKLIKNHCPIQNERFFANAQNENDVVDVPVEWCDDRYFFRKQKVGYPELVEG